MTNVYVGNVPARVVERQEWRNGSIFDRPPEGPPPMPFSIRMRLGLELNKAWREFTEEMHDGDLTGPAVAEKFWKYLTR